MGKRKVKVEDAPLPKLLPCKKCGGRAFADEESPGDHGKTFIYCRNRSCNSDGPTCDSWIAAAEAWNEKQAITDAEMDDVCDVLTDSLASLADLRAAGPPAVKELRRLRAEVAAKDAEIARLTAELNVARFMNTPMDNLPAPE